MWPEQKERADHIFSHITRAQVGKAGHLHPAECTGRQKGLLVRLVQGVFIDSRVIDGHNLQVRRQQSCPRHEPSNAPKACSGASPNPFIKAALGMSFSGRPTCHSAAHGLCG